ncbi:MAG: hypothetical protein ACRCVW_00780 [Brevinema sp.]
MRNILFVIVMLTGSIFAQDNTVLTNSVKKEIPADQGWYWQNAYMGKWNPFGSLYQTRLYYRHALHRDQGTFWFKDSALMVGLEQEFSIFSRTSLFLYWQPVIAVNFTARVIFEYDFAGSIQMNGPNDDYTSAFPPFTGLNPLTRTPIRNKFSNFIFEFAPEFTFGGPAGPGMVALIYRPQIFYFHSIGYGADQFYYNNREGIILKGRDIFFRHDIKLGYSLTGTGMSFALVSLIEHVLSGGGDLFRVGVFGGFQYEKATKNNPNLIPYVRVLVGTWVVERFLFQTFAMQWDIGLKWKFK